MAIGTYVILITVMGICHTMYLQLCYEVCRTMLSNDVVHDAVGAYNDGRSFAPEVVAMLKDSLAKDGSGVSFLHPPHICMYTNSSVYMLLLLVYQLLMYYRTFSA